MAPIGFHALSSGLQISCDWLISPREMAARMAGLGSSRVSDSVPLTWRIMVSPGCNSGSSRTGFHAPTPGLQINCESVISLPARWLS